VGRAPRARYLPLMHPESSARVRFVRDAR
jgi:hypothetical protein